MIIACDAGGTGTRVGLYAPTGEAIAEAVGDAANPVECGVAASVRAVAEAVRSLAAERVDVLAAAISGAANRTLRDEMAAGLRRLVRAERLILMSDLHPILWANRPNMPGLLAISGTGSSVLAHDGGGTWRIIGGRGRAFGDDGSAYAIGIAAMRAAADAVDGLGPATALVDELPRTKGLGSFNDMTRWAAEATKSEIAYLAPVVTLLATQGDDVARFCILTQAHLMARQVVAAARGLRIAEDTPVLTHGSVLNAPGMYREAFKAALAEAGLHAETPALRGHRAVAELVRHPLPEGDWISQYECADEGPNLPATELHSTGQPLDALTPAGIVRRMAEEDASIALAIAAVEPEIAACVAAAADAVKSGGRVVYIGAGTSGRLGVLDASECPPTFGVDPGVFIGIMAGGDRALRDSVEGAEDDENAGAADLAALGIGARDFVVGISASGTTPYVAGALRYAKSVGATAAILCCNPATPIRADIVAAIDTGAEVLAGSTRLKAGTATKMALNMISTGAFALAGLVYQGYMVGVRPVNVKLRKRAAGIVSALAGCSAADGAVFLERAGMSVAVAVVMARKGIDRPEAEAVLKRAGTLRGVFKGE